MIVMPILLNLKDHIAKATNSNPPLAKCLPDPLYHFHISIIYAILLPLSVPHCPWSHLGVDSQGSPSGIVKKSWHPSKSSPSPLSCRWPGNTYAEQNFDLAVYTVSNQPTCETDNSTAPMTSNTDDIATK